MKLDMRGKACPLPVIEAKRALESGRGESVEVWVDNEVAVQNLQKLAGQKRVDCRAERLGEREFRVVFGANGESGEAIATDGRDVVSDVRPGLLAVIGSDRMGQGDDVLGRLLMKSYIYALAQLDELPEAILLYNGGAFLSCEGSDSVEDLKQMEARGVQVLTCGTCLNHYHLSDKLAVGGVTNMYEIVERQANAQRIMRP